MDSLWRKHTKKMDHNSINDSVNTPSEFQIEYAEFLSDLNLNNHYVLEPGCEQGTVSLLLRDTQEISLLDINEDIVIKLFRYKDLFRSNDVKIFHGDMFQMPFDDGTFNLVHNSGVLEHFNADERKLALKEYARVTKRGGYVAIGLPNHKSFPYRSAYLFHNYFLARLFWKWPKEYKINRLESEIPFGELELCKRVCLAKNTVFNLWRPFNFIGLLLKFIDKYFNFEGYLEVYLFKKIN